MDKVIRKHKQHIKMADDDIATKRRENGEEKTQYLAN